MSPVQPSVLSAKVLQKCKRIFKGEIITPVAGNYLSACELYNSMKQFRPTLILRCNTEEDVSTAIKFCSDNVPNVSIKGGGHNLSGVALNNGGVTIDISTLRSVEILPDNEYVRVQGGCRLGDIDSATAKVGKAVPIGTVSDTGIGGLALGGGIGWLLPRYGLTCDNIEQIELIDHKGQAITASSCQEADLFWALRGGGGGNFGVVTNFIFKMHPISNVLAGSVVFKLRDTQAAVNTLRAINQENDTSMCAMLNMIALPEYNDCASIDFCCSDINYSEALLKKRFLEFSVPVEYSIRKIAFAKFQRLFDTSAQKGFRRYAKSIFFNDLTDEFTNDLLQCFINRPSVSTTIFLEEFHGEFRNGSRNSNLFNSAFCGREACYNLHIQCAWKDSMDDPVNLDWLAESFRRLLKHTNPCGSYLNYNSDLLNSEELFTKSSVFERIALIKSRYDPYSFFKGTFSTNSSQK